MTLGMAWLFGLGEVRVNFREFTLRIAIMDEFHLLKGESDLRRAAASLNSILKALRDQGQGFLV